MAEKMKEYTIFYHDGGIMWACDEKSYPRGWYVWSDGEAHCAHMPEEVQDRLGESSW